MKIVNCWLGNKDEGVKLLHSEQECFQEQGCFSFIAGTWLIEGEPDPHSGLYSPEQITDVTRSHEFAFVHYSDSREYFVSDTKLSYQQIKEWLTGKVTMNAHISVIEQLTDMGFTQIRGR